MNYSYKFRDIKVYGFVGEAIGAFNQGRLIADVFSPLNTLIDSNISFNIFRALDQGIAE